MKSRLKFTIPIIVVLLLTIAGLVGFGVWHSASNTPTFTNAGYILGGNTQEVKHISFAAGTSYSNTLSGEIKVASTDGGIYTVPKQSFVRYDNSSIMALSDGILLDFDDLTDNFINNYYIAAGLQITESGGSYIAETTAGTMQFGEHIWKLSDSRYIIVASSIKVCLGNKDDIREVAEYVQVYTSEDGIVYLLTTENIWMTISDSCYIETAGGVKTYPVTKIVDDGTYKLSLAKLSVSTEDAIFLTEDESRRQIVPELNFTAVDGEDGKDGNTGTDGAAGAAGEDGAVGNQGATGASGGAGGAGDGGTPGVGGKPGDGGINGQGGDPGEKGDPGDPGGTGGIGTAGSDALVESSTNNAIPSMTIKDWRVSANELKGVIGITDNSGLLEAMQGKSQQYPGKVSITNVKTGEVIYCYEVNYEDGVYDVSQITPGETAFEKFYSTDLVPFATYNKPLTPDTEYKLSVVAYYTTPDNSGIVYSREFVSRRFYTDSTGVNLSYVSASQSSITVNATLSDSYKESVKNVTVYLLTPAQNAKFTAASIQAGATDYIDSVPLSIDDFKNQSVQTVVFDGRDDIKLDHNMTYIARVYVETDQIKTLTKQELEVKTLKAAPAVDKNVDGTTLVPLVNYSRQNGAFEVYRPAVIDPDGGAVNYIYTAYRLEAGVWVKEKEDTVPAGTKDPRQFWLNTGDYYRFGITLEFFDNEKTVYYELGYTDSIKAEGDTMPKLTLRSNNSGIDYDKFQGSLIINLGANSYIETADVNKPLKLELFADGLMSGATAIEVAQGKIGLVNGKDTTMGTVTVKSVTESQIELELDLKKLYKDTNYAIILSGYLNVGDANGLVSRAIGTVTFRTYNTVQLIASYVTPTSDEAGTAALAQYLTLNIADGDGNDPTYAARAGYALDRLIGGSTTETDPCGQVSVTLYQGVGANKRLIAIKNYNEKEQMEALFNSTKGLLITDDDFGVSVNAGTSYTLMVSSVSDSSYLDNDLGYTNTFDDIINPTGTTSGVTQPPDLTDTPNNSIVVTPIYNKDAAIYGATVSEELPDIAIIGFTLAAKYENSQRIGKTITYYVYEASAFFNAMESFDINSPVPIGSTPLNEMLPLMKMSKPINNTSDEVPKVAIIFGNTGSATTDEQTKYFNGYEVYYSAAANFTSSLQSGMGRGFRYVFGYEVDYVIGGTGADTGIEETRKYPYSHGSYTSFQKQYGGIEVDKKTYGKAYVLTSPVCEAPRILPDFHMYVSSTHEDPVGTSTVAPATGTVTLHYTWRDAEAKNNPTDPSSRMVVTSGENITTISYETGSTVNPVESISIVAKQVENDWYEVTIPYSHTYSKTELAILSPQLNISAYRIDYSPYIEAALEELSMPLGPIPMDWSYDEMFANSGYQNVVLEQTYVEEDNYIIYYFYGDAADSIAERAIAVDLTFTAKDDNGRDMVETLKLPVVYDAATARACVRVMTSELGSRFLRRDFVVSNATLYYDNGSQGWSLAKQNAPFAIQYLDEEGGLGNYLGAVVSGEIRASGALSRTNVDNVEALLRTTIDNDDSKNDIKVGFTRISLVPKYGGGTYYIYPTVSGVDAGSSNNPTQLSGNIMLVKGVSTYKMKFATGSGGFSDTIDGRIENMTPTADYTRISATTNSLNFEALEVNGFIGEGFIYIQPYLTENDAMTLSSNYVQLAKKVSVAADGKVENEDTVISDLLPEKTYYIALYYIDSNGDRVLLINTKNAQKAVYKVVTSKNNTIEFVDMEYLNDSYLDKSLSMEFTMSMTVRQTLRYDIYSSQETASLQDETGIVLSYEQLKRDNLISVPSVLGHANNKIRLLLEPRNERRMLLPGVTYYLRITAEENGEVSGFGIQPFTLNSIGSYGALIYTQNASGSSLSFNVTITDAQYSLMGDRTYGAKYAVRFTDANGKRLYTKYDNEIYYAFEPGKLQRTFILDNDHLETDFRNPESGIAPKTNYMMHIYAVPDDDHNGSITLSYPGSDGVWVPTLLKWSDVFADDTVQGVTKARIHHIIDSFWDANGNDVSSKDSEETKLHIADKLQITTSISNWLLNEDNVYTTRPSTSRVRVNLSESIGLIKPDGTPIFSQIDWQVEGTANNGTPIKATGTVKRSSNAQALLQFGRSAGQDVYYYDIPYDLPQGFYTIVIQLREKENDPSPTHTLTIRSGV